LYDNYDKEKAEQYWTRRVSDVNELRAVLSWRSPDYENSAYSQWELGLLVRELGDVRSKTVLDVGFGVGRSSYGVAESRCPRDRLGELGENARDHSREG
jgi:hypothetical protein